MAKDSSKITLSWDWGTAYDFFVSLYVLHQPNKFGLRASWAAGVRSRLPAEPRRFLEESQNFMHTPLNWLYKLPQPKDVQTVLWALRNIPAEDRLMALAEDPKVPKNVTRILRDTANNGHWTQTEIEILSGQYPYRHFTKPAEAALTALQWWSRAKESGECYLEALQAYQNVFFQEEEERIRPVLKQALENAQERSRIVDAFKLVEELSQGVLFPAREDLGRLVLAPSYWSTPLIVFGWVAEDMQLVLFGARPAESALIPGDWVPDTLVRSLKAAGDPTRLRILRYLAQDPLTPAQLARLLRLRPPTVIHHLNELRLAGMVHVILSEDDEKRYAIRRESIAGMYATLQKFLEINIEVIK